MRSTLIFSVFIFAGSFISTLWAQAFRPLTFSSKTLYHNDVKNDSIKIYNPHAALITIDSVEMWGEHRTEGSMVRLGIDYGPIRYFLWGEKKPIKQGIFTWSRVDTLKNRHHTFRPMGHIWISGFGIDRCPACKQSTVSGIRDTLQFKFIFHYANISDTLLVITDNKIGLSLYSRIGNPKKWNGLNGKPFDFLGREILIPEHPTSLNPYKVAF